MSRDAVERPQDHDRDVAVECVEQVLGNTEAESDEDSWDCTAQEKGLALELRGKVSRTGEFRGRVTGIGELSEIVTGIGELRGIVTGTRDLAGYFFICPFHASCHREHNQKLSEFFGEGCHHKVVIVHIDVG